TDMGFKLEDFMVEVDLNDPFFAQVNASVNVNADYAKFDIDSVDVHLEYTKTNPATIQDFHFKKSDDVGHFLSDTANGDMNYAYPVAVNYKDQAQAYQSPLIETNKGQITVNANDLGILCVDLQVGSVDFTKTPQVQVSIEYPDADANGRPVSQQFTFDKSKSQDTMLAVILKQVNKPYRYQILYILADGSQFTTDWKEQNSSTLYINSPFITRSYTLFAQGDFTTGIDTILLKLKYVDAVNKIEQDTSYSFTAQNRSHDWPVSTVINSKGKVTYSGV